VWVLAGFLQVSRCVHRHCLVKLNVIHRSILLDRQRHYRGALGCCVWDHELLTT
jgi:hypothetical protein